MRRAKSLRIGVHHADAAVWGPAYRTHLDRLAPPPSRRELVRGDETHGLQTLLVVVRLVASLVPHLADVEPLALVPHRQTARHVLGCVPYERTSGWS